MKFYNTIDDKLRFVEVKVTNESSGQSDTHTFSYLFCREQLKEVGYIMGLDNEERQAGTSNYITPVR